MVFHSQSDKCWVSTPLAQGDSRYDHKTLRRREDSLSITVAYRARVICRDLAHIHAFASPGIPIVQTTHGDWKQGHKNRERRQEMGTLSAGCRGYIGQNTMDLRITK